MRSKGEIWKRFGEVYQPAGGVPGEEPTNKSMYCKCSACDEPVVAASGRLRDHWDKCKKRPRAIGQLDAGFQPSRKTKCARLQEEQEELMESLECQELRSAPQACGQVLRIEVCS
jgi:hypothetical protein